MFFQQNSLRWDGFVGKYPPKCRNQVRETQKYKKFSGGGPQHPPTNSCIFKLTISGLEQFVYAPHKRFIKKALIRKRHEYNSIDFNYAHSVSQRVVFFKDITPSFLSWRAIITAFVMENS